MPIPKSQKALSALFRQLGARDPDQWAESEVAERIPRLLRFLFLREAWRYVQGENDHSWIDREIANSKLGPGEPYAQLGSALERCRGRGVLDQDLTDIARCLQASMLFNICSVMDAGPRDVPESLEDVAWALFRVNENDRPVGAPIDGLHESVLDTDPTCREMRPR